MHQISTSGEKAKEEMLLRSNEVEKAILVTQIIWLKVRLLPSIF
jgi:hypothetical protein